MSAKYVELSTNVSNKYVNEGRDKGRGMLQSKSENQSLSQREISISGECLNCMWGEFRSRVTIFELCRNFSTIRFRGISIVDVDVNMEIWWVH